MTDQSKVAKALKLLELIEDQQTDFDLFSHLKPLFMGEHSVSFNTQCTHCEEEGADDDCEYCWGAVDVTHIVFIPWTTQKEIIATAFQTLTKLADQEK